jgi:hypothetical protein
MQAYQKSNNDAKLFMLAKDVKLCMVKGPN